MNIIQCLDNEPFPDYESRIVVGVISKEEYIKHKVFALIMKGEQVAFVGYALNKEQMLKKSYFFSNKEIDEAK